jgi:hypothetical protein
MSFSASQLPHLYSSLGISVDRLSLLPHIDTFPEYKPHVSLAYIRADQVDHWQWALEAKQHVFAVDTTTDARGLMGALWDGDVKAEVAL